MPHAQSIIVTSRSTSPVSAVSIMSKTESALELGLQKLAGEELAERAGSTARDI